MRCGNCGAEIDNGMTSCPYCGATVRYMGQSNNSWQQGGWSGQNTGFNQGYQISGTITMTQAGLRAKQSLLC